MSNDSQISEAVIKNSRRLTPIWLLPIIALLIVSWLGWRTVNEAGIEIHVQFDSGRGIKAGKTEVVHNGLVVGMVSALTATGDMNAVDVVIEIDPHYAKYLREESQFWLVRPQISMAGVSGLDTLVSGNYIAFKPSNEGKKSLQFKALKQPPPLAEESEGLRLNLRAKELSSLSVGSPVYYRRFKVGEVTGYSLASNGEYVDIQLYVNQEFASLIKQNTRFWNAGGIDISGNLPNLKVRTQSLLSMIQGGIAFYTPDWGEPGQPAADDDQYVLYSDYEQAEAGIPITIEFPLNVSLGQANTPILFHGFEVGRVQELDISEDLSKVTAEAVVRPEVMPGLVEGAQFWVVEPRFGPKGVSGLDTLLSGRYIGMDVSRQDVEKGVASRHFQGQAQRPPVPTSAPGLHLTLNAEALSGVSAGSPVLFRNIPVGSVQEYKLKGNGVDIRLLIEPEFSHLVNKSSRFWNVSGVSVDAGLDGVKIRSATLNTLISGGIAFKTPELRGRKVKDGERFHLFDDEESATKKGITLSIQFETADGLSEGSQVKYRGMKVGVVTALAVNPNREGVIAEVFLEKQYKWLASAGTQFWLVKPKLGLANTSHLETLLTGPYIGVQPQYRRGAIETKFIAINGEPDNQRRSLGLDIELVSPGLGSIKRGNAVYYRDIPVGEVTGYKLGNPADHVVIFINIEDRYAGLVSEHSKFWNASGIDMKVGLFSGAKVRTESLEALLAGGIAFATPEIPEKPVKDGKQFKLYSKVDSDWLDWQPKIKLKD